jgi:copper chaperone
MAPWLSRDTPKGYKRGVEMSTATYTVAGMTCGHCVNSVKEEVGQVEGVSAVEVDLESGRVTVSSAAPLDVAQVRAAVEEAGYELKA